MHPVSNQITLSWPEPLSSHGGGAIRSSACRDGLSNVLPTIGVLSLSCPFLIEKWPGMTAYAFPGSSGEAHMYWCIRVSIYKYSCQEASDSQIESSHSLDTKWTQLFNPLAPNSIFRIPTVRRTLGTLATVMHYVFNIEYCVKIMHYVQDRVFCFPDHSMKLLSLYHNSSTRYIMVCNAVCYYLHICTFSPDCISPWSISITNIIYIISNRIVYCWSKRAGRCTPIFRMPVWKSEQRAGIEGVVTQTQLRGVYCQLTVKNLCRKLVELLLTKKSGNATEARRGVKILDSHQKFWIHTNYMQ